MMSLQLKQGAVGASAATGLRRPPLASSSPPSSSSSTSNLSMLSSSSSSPFNRFVSGQTQVQFLPPNNRTPNKVLMRIASPSSKQAYICRDCGYIYNDRTPFEKLPDKYFCPVCGAPKRRFKPYQPAVAKNANDTAVRKARKEQLKRDESIGQALPFAIALGAAALAGLYFYLNQTY